MIKSTSIKTKILDYYKYLQNRKSSYDIMVENLLLKNENYVNIENQIGKIKFEIAKAYFDKNNEIENTLEIKLKDFENQKSKIKSKILEGVKPYKYDCEICKDSAFLNGKPCKCYNDKVVKYCFDTLGLKKVNYPSFSQGIYSENKVLSNKLIKYCEDFPNNKILNFVFFGKSGTGKTHLAKCIANEVELKGNSVLFLSATDLNYVFLKMHLGEIDKIAVLDVLKQCDLLVIDDLGTEPIFTNVTIEYLLDLISSRISYQKHFIITTNLSSSEIISRYNERIQSRLSDKTTTAILPFKHDDFRKKLNK